VSRRATIQQRSARNRGCTARRITPLHGIRSERAASDHRQPSLDPPDVDAFALIHRQNSHNRLPSIINSNSTSQFLSCAVV
jgi:hypothetical protein